MRYPLLTAAFAGVLLAGPTTSQGQERVEIGVLDCVVKGGSGFIFGSTKDLSCTFDPAGDDRSNEVYFGAVNKWGIDIGTTNSAVIKWAVLAPTSDPYVPGALVGDYVGVSGEVTVGAGIGANALIGGSNDTVILQPLSIQAQQGLNFALGIAEIELRTAEDTRPA